MAGFVLGAILAVVGWGCASEAREVPPKRPNIIAMYSDDHAVQAVGAYRRALDYSLQLEHTPIPNIDQLAEEGMGFDQFHLRSVPRHDAQRHAQLHQRSDELNFVPSLRQDVGYQTAMIDKWHLKSEPRGFATTRSRSGSRIRFPSFRTGTKIMILEDEGGSRRMIPF